MAKADNEVVIAMVGALGCDLETTQELIQKALEEVGYKYHVIRLSDLIGDVPGYTPSAKCSSEFFDERVEALMDAGNDIRAGLGGDALAKLAVMRIRDIRDRLNDGHGEEDSNIPLSRTAYILRSLKHPDEVRFLRGIYGDSFFLFAAYSPKKQRIMNLSHRIRESRHRHRADEFEPRAIQLIQKDEEEPSNKMGQHVRKTFWLGDAFIDASSKDEARDDIFRVIRCWFGHPYITPTRDEFSMFCARAAAFRSASMGRQVGAAISDSDGAVIATGTNEIPRFGGGHYWDGDDPDGRDHARGHDSSDTMIRELVEDVVDRLLQVDWSPPEQLAGRNVRELAIALISDPRMDGAEFQSLMEYMRPVHAEMSAISDAARRGVAVKGTSLFCTTFPCHSCARHIVAVGIERVVYIEPYAKSLVKTLYDDSIAVDEWCQGEQRVRFEPYIGIAPRRYLSFFAMGSRKVNGKVIDWKPVDASPRIGEWEDWLAVEKENRMAKVFRQDLLNTAWNNEVNEEDRETTNTDASLAGETVQQRGENSGDLERGEA